MKTFLFGKVLLTGALVSFTLSSSLPLTFSFSSLPSFPYLSFFLVVKYTQHKIYHFNYFKVKMVFLTLKFCDIMYIHIVLPLSPPSIPRTLPSSWTETLCPLKTSAPFPIPSPWHPPFYLGSMNVATRGTLCHFSFLFNPDAVKDYPNSFAHPTVPVYHVQRLRSRNLFNLQSS